MAMLKHEAEEDGISDATTLRLASSPDMDDSFAELSPHGTEEPPMHLHGTEGYPPRNPRCGVPMVGCTCHHGAACRARGEDDASISQKSVASSHVLAFDGEGGAEQKHKRQRIENERKVLVEKHFDVTWEKLNQDLRACLYYRLVDEGKAKAPEEDEENMFANDAANSSKERRCS